MSVVRIGPYTLPNRLILAPMAGVTDRPFSFAVALAPGWWYRRW